MTTKTKTSFDAHLSAVQSRSKTAGAVSHNGGFADDSGVLSKIAEQLGMLSGEQPAAASAPAEMSAPTHVAGVPVDGNVAVGMGTPTSVTDQIVLPAIAQAGADVAAVLEGSNPTTRPVDVGTPGLTGTGIPGDVGTAKTEGLAPEAVAANLDPEMAKEASVIGSMIADAFYSEIESRQKTAAFNDAVVFLNDRGLLDGYRMPSSLTKTASSEASIEDIVARFESRKAVTADEVIKVANLVAESEAEDAAELHKQASAAHSEQDTAAFMQKLASDFEATKAREQANLMTKIAGDPQAVNCVKYLQAKKYI